MISTYSGILTSSGKLTSIEIFKLESSDSVSSNITGSLKGSKYGSLRTLIVSGSVSSWQAASISSPIRNVLEELLNSMGGAVQDILL